MAGQECSGVSHANKNLFNNKTIIICDKEKSNSKNIKIISDIFINLNMNIVYMNAKEHDEHASYVSHMPHIISFSLANSVLKHEQAENITSLAGGGFNDIARIAKSSPLMWVDIFKNNKNNMVKSLNEFENEFKRAKQMIIDEDWDSLSDWIKYANNLQHIL
jgi:prephenate dehydrogenase